MRTSPSRIVLAITFSPQKRTFVTKRSSAKSTTMSKPLTLADITDGRSSEKTRLVTDCSPEDFADPFCQFMRENPTVWHVADYFKKKLSERGFSELSERDDWVGKMKPGGKYYVVRNGSCLAAFTIGRAYRPGNGFAMVGSHIDVLTARLKPVSTLASKAGYLQLAVAPYSGTLGHTWWDRDLSIGGRVIVSERASPSPSSATTTSVRLVNLDWPVAKIPTLAPHFGVGGFGDVNKETQAVPIIGLTGDSGGVASCEDEDEDEREKKEKKKSEKKPLGPEGSFVNDQPRRLVELVARQLGLKDPSSIVSWDLDLYDSQPAQRSGLDREFISSSRLDDQLCSWSAMVALLAAEDDEKAGHVRLVALFDNEEIGSLLRQGARSNFLPLLVERTIEALSSSSSSSSSSAPSPSSSSSPNNNNNNNNKASLLGQTYARSFLLSADVTHAGNPNFLGHYLDKHVPRLNVGLAVKTNSNGHNTTDAVSDALLHRVADLCGSKLQRFQIRNDSRSGGTIGPALSSAMGVRSADAGIPQLAMHSLREMTGALDPGLGVRFFKGFFDHWEKVDAEWEH
ncbi:hypothetical protein L249_2034 [Ophiocordyceps polyrhachis-furcata BCC 54312]|uniref:Aspartyl aminopeptidase n=1 Tax=Ophiocordyceps polyrhachis-furcata BCC 54312 TaxID=1330021 RepID=A0A367LNH7_9HYPO|nr:hypothetical protein L249_2034 [Ophiocordyceps polyrhachis-furcata BCC 54312]